MSQSSSQFVDVFASKVIAMLNKPPSPVKCGCGVELLDRNCAVCKSRLCFTCSMKHRVSGKNGKTYEFRCKKCYVLD